ncbi:MAG: metalloregulator ArsR/SmtB family transcription factor [Ilumatobacteraceae bacterium]
MTRDAEPLGDDGLDEAVKAMSHPGRRAMLRLARDGERTATELADAAGLAPSAASPHLKLLKEVGLMHVRVDAKRRLYSVDFERLAQVRAVFDELWADQLDVEASCRVGYGVEAPAGDRGSSWIAPSRSPRHRRTYALLTQADLLVEWMAPIASLDPRPGGEVSWTHANGNTVRSQYVELVPDRRVVFTYGWERADVGVRRVRPWSRSTSDRPPAAPRLRLVHRGLEGPMADAHAGGWANYLARLAAASGRDRPGTRPARRRSSPHQRGTRPRMTAPEVDEFWSVLHVAANSDVGCASIAERPPAHPTSLAFGRTDVPRCR